MHFIVHVCNKPQIIKYVINIVFLGEHSHETVFNAYILVPCHLRSGIGGHTEKNVRDCIKASATGQVATRFEPFRSSRLKGVDRDCAR